MTRWRSSRPIARWAAPRRAGLGGTSLAATTRPRSMVTGPREVSTVRVSWSRVARVPTASVRVAPVASSGVSSRHLTTTRDPTGSAATRSDTDA